ncbi:MAG: FHA domain-containing protein [Geitlerinemataceae cyanobacterium]
MHWTLTLTWTEIDRIQTETIDSLKHSDTANAFRLGRDPSQCDLVLVDNTVSRLHVEVFFKPDWQRFYLKNLQPKNPPKIDGGVLISGEVALNSGSTIELGQLQLTIVDISDLKPYSPPVAEIVSKIPKYSPPEALRSPILFARPNYGLECPHCHHFSPLDMRNSACTHCGHFLADAESILIPPSG